MTVGAITSYSSVLQNQYFGCIISSANIQNLMLKYGIQITGDPELDIKALYAAMRLRASTIANTKAQQASADQPTDNTQNSNIQWATLMNQIGLSATGNLATDYAAFSNKISTMQLSATTPQEKANINQLQAQANIVFVQQDQSSKRTSQVQSTTASGAEIMASLNKLYLL